MGYRDPRPAPEVWMEQKNGEPIVAFASTAEWEEWLAANHATSRALWVKIAKKGAGVTTTTYAETLDGALCYGWIDGQKGTYDERFFVQRFTPRGPRSKWSRINVEKVDRLIEQGRMRPPGLVQVERARADGRWDAAYDSASRATVPEDLQRALDGDPAAAAFFATLNSVNRYAITYRLQSSVKAETRARRLEQFVAMLREGKKLHP
jgi:uncharacterized protein YdeI (YjbR/CyaY-like superfamily)